MSKAEALRRAEEVFTLLCQDPVVWGVEGRPSDAQERRIVQVVATAIRQAAQDRGEEPSGGYAFV